MLEFVVRAHAVRITHPHASRHACQITCHHTTAPLNSDAVDVRGLQNVLIGVGAGVVAHDELKALFYEIDAANRGYITWQQLSDCLYPHMRKGTNPSLPNIAPPPRRTGGKLLSPVHKRGGKKGSGKSASKHKDLCVGGRNSNFASRVNPLPFVDECAAGRAEVSKVFFSA